MREKSRKIVILKGKGDTFLGLSSRMQMLIFLARRGKINQTKPNL